ncbi:hypothetical protein L2091_07855 [Curtobacterium albidum]|uniref:hypothetical protein n=1 Tax=Curtobacterium citreum TaxID=2036 RepID=UPI002026847C|nr:hypothetical protein [Curtobacterium albidum]MCL9665142.1 hypothetical protein [Curtobacterium albidum]
MMRFPSWVCGERVLLRAEWDGRPSSSDGLTDSLLTQLRGVDAVLGDGEPWQVDGVGPVLGYDVAVVHELFQRGVERGADGSAWPEHGCSVIMNRQAEHGFVSLSLKVGASVPGRRRPANAVSVTVVGPVAEGERRAPDVELIEEVLATVVRAWDPDSAGAFDRAAARAVEDMGRFAPVVGQRTWVSERLGAVPLTTSGVAKSSLYRGTLLAADDALDSPTAVAAVRETLKALGITTLPRTGRTA